MIILAKQKNENSKLHLKEFDSAPEVARYLKVSDTAVYYAMGKHGSKQYKLKGWYVDQIEDKI